MYKNPKRAMKINSTVALTMITLFIILSIFTNNWMFTITAFWSVSIVYFATLSQIRKSEIAQKA